MKPEIGVESFGTSSGGRIYRLPLEAFPGFWTFAYLVLVGNYRVLIDTGSGFGASNENLESRLGEGGLLASGEAFKLSDLTHIFITHGHIDHYGGLNYILPHTDALLGVHELDLRILTNYDERMVVVSRKLEEFLIEAGVSDRTRQNLLAMYRFTKELFHSVPVDFTYEEAGMRVGPFEFFHVPGHCAGHVVIRLDEVLFCGDHVIDNISPHQSPEHLSLGTGLDHYLRSLDRLEDWAGGVRLALSGHNKPITDLAGRIQDIKGLHAERLERALDFFAEPHSINELSNYLFGKVNGYNVLLAIEEAGAHVEYLYQRGQLRIENLGDLDTANGPIQLQYRRNE